MNMKFSTLVIVAMLSLFVSCDKEDDIDEIFCNGMFQITGMTYNGIKTVKDVSEFYKQENTYRIKFNKQTFQGTLQAGSHIEGIWNADGTTHFFSMQFGSNTNVTNSNNAIQQKIYQILSGARKYSGDSNVLKIHDDKDSFVELRRI